MATNKTLTQQSIKLDDVRTWVCDKLRSESDKETREALFRAQLYIGFALLRLQEANYRTNEFYDETQ